MRLFILLLFILSNINIFSQNEKIPNGSFKEYYENNQLKIEGNYLRNVRTGLWKFWYSNGKLKSSIEYKRGYMNGYFKLYWPDGKLKREEIHKHGRFIKGICFNENGDTIKFFNYEVLPQFLGGKEKFNEFIRDNLKYPVEYRRDRITGTAYVYCTIDNKGNLVNATVHNKTHKLFEEEALRVISLIKKWKPGQRDGENVEMNVVYPISFSLEYAYK